MDAIAEVFPTFRVNKNASCLIEKNFSSERPNGSYLLVTSKQLGRTRETLSNLIKNVHCWTQGTNHDQAGSMHMQTLASGSGINMECEPLRHLYPFSFCTE